MEITGTFGSLSIDRSYPFEEEKTVESFRFDESLQVIEVVFRKKSNATYSCTPPKPVPDRVWKERYGIVNGRIAFLKVIQGEHTPGKFIPESIEFDE